MHSAKGKKKASSSTQERDYYEVFLSFRGKDTRTNFTDHLYNALSDRGIHTFRDNEELRIGEEVGLALRSAIHQSKIAIPIFSKYYASSKWCLRELAEIVECRKQVCQRQISVMPVFYHVHPSEVRNQTGSYEEAFRDHEKNFDQEILAGWKKALREVGGLKGWVLEEIADGHEGKLIKLIVKEVWNGLRKSPLTVSDNLVGIRSHVQQIKKLLNIGSDDIWIVGIHGLGGIGKTTIARCAYNEVYHHFEGCCFVADVRETFPTKGEVVRLQSQLLTNILNLENPNITSIDQGIDVIKKKLCNKKVLIALDDVDQSTYLKAIIGKRDWFGIGSKIIITTRDRHILDVLEANKTYEPKEMDSDQSLQLFSKHAFKMDRPPEQYLILSKNVVKTTGGLPLALEVLGSYLVCKDESIWKETVKTLTKIPNYEVQKKLRISYDGLIHEEQEMFLDIACFLIGMDKNIACYIWDGSDFSPKAGIENLRLKSLVKIGEENELKMHDQLRDLGREIVRQESLKELGKRSRLWLHDEAWEVLSTKMGTKKVEGLHFNFGSSHNQCLTSKGFATMTKLRLLQVEHAKVSGNFVHSFSELRWLSWKRCPMDFTPSNLRKLRVLDLSYSDITESWMGWNYIEVAENLKVLHLSGCDKLSQIPEVLANLPLEALILRYCNQLATIDTFIGHLKRLVRLDICGCKSLMRLPELPSSLEYLNTSRCKMKSLPTLSTLENLEVLCLDGFESLVEIPTTINALTRLKLLNLDQCHGLQYIPHLPSSLKSLKANYCSKLREISAFLDMRNLEELCLNHCYSLEKIGSLEGLDSLQQFEINYCYSLRKLPKLQGSKKLRYLEFNNKVCLFEIEGLEGLYSLEKLIIEECHLLRVIGNLSDLKNLLCIKIQNCCELSRIEGLEELYSLEELIIEECQLLRVIPNLSGLKNLVCIKIRNCYKVYAIEGLEGLYSLEELIIEECHLLKVIPNLSELKNLMFLKIRNSCELSEIDGVQGLYSLKELIIEQCHLLRVIPKLSDLKNLVCIKIQNCRELSEIEGLKGLYSLKELIIEECHLLRVIPNLPDLKNLVCIKIHNCRELLEIEGLEELNSLEELSLSHCRLFNKIQIPKKLRILDIHCCYNLSEIEGLKDLESLTKFDLKGYQSIRRLPGLSKLKTLKHLSLGYSVVPLENGFLEGLESLEELQIDMATLKVLPDISTLKNLKGLEVRSCSWLERLPNLSRFNKLIRLCILYCSMLTEIPSVDRLESLEVLQVVRCESLEILPDLSNLTKLQELHIKKCARLTQIPGVDWLKNLQILSIDGCISIGTLPCLSNLWNLRTITAYGCEKLMKIRAMHGVEIYGIGSSITNWPESVSVKVDSWIQVTHWYL